MVVDHCREFSYRRVRLHILYLRRHWQSLSTERKVWHILQWQSHKAGLISLSVLQDGHEAQSPSWVRCAGFCINELSAPERFRRSLVARMTLKLWTDTGGQPWSTPSWRWWRSIPSWIIRRHSVERELNLVPKCRVRKILVGLRISWKGSMQFIDMLWNAGFINKTKRIISFLRSLRECFSTLCSRE